MFSSELAQGGIAKGLFRGTDAGGNGLNISATKRRPLGKNNSQKHGTLKGHKE